MTDTATRIPYPTVDPTPGGPAAGPPPVPLGFAIPADTVSNVLSSMRASIS